MRIVALCIERERLYRIASATVAGDNRSKRGLRSYLAT